MMKKSLSLVHNVTNFAYILVSIILFAISFTIIIWSVSSMFFDITSPAASSTDYRLDKILDEVAYIIFSVAVADVARYLIVEEVIKGKEHKPLSEKRKALSNLILIISTAFALEGLILTIKIAKTNVEKLNYPILMIVVSSLMLISLGIYQKLSSTGSKEKTD